MEVSHVHSFTGSVIDIITTCGLVEVMNISWRADDQCLREILPRRSRARVRA